MRHTDLSKVPQLTDAEYLLLLNDDPGVIKKLEEIKLILQRERCIYVDNLSKRDKRGVFRPPKVASTKQLADFERPNEDGRLSNIGFGYNPDSWSSPYTE